MGWEVVGPLSCHLTGAKSPGRAPRVLEGEGDAALHRFSGAAAVDIPVIIAIPSGDKLRTLPGGPGLVGPSEQPTQLNRSPTRAGRGGHTTHSIKLAPQDGKATPAPGPEGLPIAPAFPGRGGGLPLGPGMWGPVRVVRGRLQPASMGCSGDSSMRRRLRGNGTPRACCRCVAAAAGQLNN